ncbi:hypothetical protein DUI87_34435 [Hirundo rustica rustica]|uniref:RNase H type-1 domain-containing protein n=1 Tax=Hirundo rustica rustica TaxID=333673 RepID=A0A3M0IQL5_HIRRU|nr:hypothetical protein DUI87_34435 [Hirundo rustica rustica]
MASIAALATTPGAQRPRLCRRSSASHDRVTKYYRSENDMSDALEGTSTMYAKEGNNNHARGALPLARKRHGKTMSFGQCGFNGLVHQSQSCVEVAGKVEKGQLAAYGKPIWAADEWNDIATQVEKLPVKVRHVDAHVPKSRANE